MADITAGTRARRALKDYGPVQFPDRLGVAVWAFERALSAGLIPAADPATGRWPAAVVAAAAAMVDEIRAAVGTLPNMGASRAAKELSQRFGIDVDPGVLLELDRRGLIPQVYKDYPLYDGQALERFADREALERATKDGCLLTRDQVAGYLGVRRPDVEHLVRAQWLEPVTWVRSGWQRRRDAPEVPLFRVADVDVLLAHPSIDWDAVRATPAGRPSPLATFSPRR